MAIDVQQEEAARLDIEAKAALDDILRFEDLGPIAEYLESKNYPILFDYIVSWECRLVIPQKDSVATRDSKMPVRF